MTAIAQLSIVHIPLSNQLAKPDSTVTLFAQLEGSIIVTKGVTERMALITGKWRCVCHLKVSSVNHVSAVPDIQKVLSLVFRMTFNTVFTL